MKPTLREPFRAMAISTAPISLCHALTALERDYPDNVPVLLVGGDAGGRLVVMREADCMFLFPPE